MHIEEAQENNRVILVNAEERQVLCKALKYAKTYLNDIELIDTLYYMGYEPQGLADEDDSIEPWYPPLDQLIVKIQTAPDNEKLLFNRSDFSILKDALDQVFNHFSRRTDKDTSNELNLTDSSSIAHMREMFDFTIEQACKKSHPNLYI